MRPFQIILFALFGALALGGLLMFAGFRGFDRDVDYVRNGVTVWGTLDRRAFEETLSELSTIDDRWGGVRYFEQDERTFKDVLVNSIAEGTGPDLIVLPHDLLISQSGKIQPISYDTYPVRDFKDAFVDGTELFALPAGIYAVPFAVDPLVMYWNRSMHSTVGLAYPPRTWEELVSVSTPALTVRADDNDIMRSAIAFGEYRNIVRAKEIIVMLFLQAGSKLVEITGTSFIADLNAIEGNANLPPADYAIRFYTEFSNPAKMNYSWNRALPEDRESFLAEDLALYFGFGSEYRSLAEGNANLNFDVAEVPQPENAPIRKTYGTFYGFAVPKSSKNPDGAYETAMELALGTHAGVLASRLELAPVRRDILADRSGSEVGDIRYRSALIARGWLDPDPIASDTALGDMIEAVTSGRAKVSEAIDNASFKIQQAF